MYFSKVFSPPKFSNTDQNIEDYMKFLSNINPSSSFNVGTEEKFDLSTSSSFNVETEEKFNLSTKDDSSDSSDSSTLISYPYLDNDQLISTEEDKNVFYRDLNYLEEKNENNKRKIFEVIYRENAPILYENESSSNDLNFLKKKRFKQRRRRRENRDNFLKKIKIGFFNNYMFKKINEILKATNSKLYFQKFPISFVNDISKKINKAIINMTLLEIFEKKELCNGKHLDNYYHNLKVVNDKEIQENEILKKILNKKYCELYEEYINSKEFKIDEINRLKDKKMDDDYIENYLYHAKYFIGFFSH